MTHTNNQRAYAFEQVPPGEYGMQAGAEGFLPAEAFVLVEPGQVAVRNFLLEPFDGASLDFSSESDSGLMALGAEQSLR